MSERGTGLLTRSPVRPHPRLHERRVQVRRAAGRRRFRRLIGLAMVLTLAGGVTIAAYSPLLDVDRVVVRGARRTPVDRVRAAAEVSVGSPMIRFDGGASAARIRALPWVDEVEVSRRWPGTVELRISERRAVAQAPRPGGGWVLLDGEARLVDHRRRPMAGLVRLADPVVGEPGQVAIDRRSLVEVAAALRPPLRSRIDSVGRRDGEVILSLDDGGRVRFGRIQEVEAKLVALDTILAAVERDCPLIDVRVPEAPVLTEGAGCA